MPPIMARNPAQISALVLIDRRLSRRDGSRRSRLHLDEAQRIALPRNQIEIAANDPRSPSACNNDEPPSPQIKERCPLSSASGDQVIGLRPSPDGDAVASIDQRLEQIQSHRCEPAHVGPFSAREAGQPRHFSHIRSIIARSGEQSLPVTVP